MAVDIALVMGSSSDWETMKETALILDRLGVSYTKQVISAHRMPNELHQFATQAQDNGLQVIIAGAGGAAHLPGMIAASTILPVIGVPIMSRALKGVDSLLSIVQMPGGVPVATVAIGKAGAQNAALLATQIIGLKQPQYQQALFEYRNEIHQKAVESSEELE